MEIPQRASGSEDTNSTTSRLSVRVLPTACIFSHMGQSAFAPTLIDLTQALGVMNSPVFEGLLAMRPGLAAAGRRRHAVGLMQTTPVPLREARAWSTVPNPSPREIEFALQEDSDVEISHAFRLPSWERHHPRAASVDGRTRDMLKAALAGAYGISDTEQELLELPLRVTGKSAEAMNSAPRPEDEDEDHSDDAAEPTPATNAILSYAIGSSFGRRDIRIARDPTLVPAVPGPFAPLPPCSPAMPVGPDGLPARSGSIVSEPWLRARPIVGTLPPASVQPATVPDAAYPLRISWSGILVDDEDHPDDIVARSREALAALFGERSAAIESEAVQLLGFEDLREDGRNPRGFWADHLRRYAKKPRKAPIYWRLQSKNRHYAVWLYYPRLDGDLLFKVLPFYLEPKIRREEQRLADLRAQIGGSHGARARRQAERALEQQEGRLADIREFRERLGRVADLHLVPNLDAGVVLNAAPLHELMPWTAPARYWRDLLQGKYDWSDIGRQIRERQGQGVKLA